MTATNATHNAFDQERAEAAVRELLIAVGEDPDREGLQETPARVARSYAEIFAGLHTDPSAVLNKTFSEEEQTEVLNALNEQWNSASEEEKSSEDYQKTYLAVGAILNIPIQITEGGVVITPATQG